MPISARHDDAVTAPPPRRLWVRLTLALSIAFCILAGIAQIVLQRAGPILKGRVVETLSTRFKAKVELDRLDVSFVRGLQVSGDGLRIYSPPDVVAAGATLPLIAIRHFSFHARLLGLFLKPTHIGTVQVAGLRIHIPPREQRKAGNSPPATAQAGRPTPNGKIKIVADEIVCDDSVLEIGTAALGKEPKRFLLKHIVLDDAGSTSTGRYGAWKYEATLTNPVPRGDIHATGTFGPWVEESPGDSNVTGQYTFDHVDLNTIKGLGGMLSSTGKFDGRLNRIAVEGTTTTPNFSLDIARHSVPLRTHFKAIVDGMTGDTYLQPVDAQLGSSRFRCSGKVINIRGRGHFIDLDMDIPDGRIEDFLTLAVRTTPAVMEGVIAMKAKLHIEPGPVSVAQRMQLESSFALTEIHFSTPKVQDQVDMLSVRAQGQPDLAKPGVEEVRSRMTGDFRLAGGKLDLHNLEYTLPGAKVDLLGVYTLDGQQFEFTGTVRTEARLSEMVSTWWKSLLLKGVDPFFAKHGAGAEIPVKISGTRSEPKFGLNMSALR